jgi:ABC-type sugar transport system ATPase subunit
MESLDLRGLTVSYEPGRPAVRDLTFSLPAGGFGVLLGASGAGKTTVLNAIAGLVRPGAGDVLVGDRSLAGVSPEHRDVAMVFENYALYPHKTVRRNLEFPLRAPVRAKELGAAGIAARVAEVAATLRIDHLLDRLPSQLSGGQRQRVSLGRALVRRPRLLLLDEPITHLDAKLRHEMRTELKRIQRDLRITTLYATPDQSDALALGDLVVVLHEGEPQQVAPAAQVWEQPANVVVAGMVGDPRMNLLPVVADGARCSAGGMTLPSPPGAAAVVVGVRPADLLLDDRPGPDTAAGRVVLDQRLGRDQVLHVDVAGRTVRAVVPAGSGHRVGSAVHVRLPQDRLFWFDEGTGRALGREAVTWRA